MFKCLFFHKHCWRITLPYFRFSFLISFSSFLAPFLYFFLKFSLFFLPPSLSPSLLSFLPSFSYSLIFPFIKLDYHILAAWACKIFTYSICKLCDTSILVPRCSQLRTIDFLPMTKIRNGQIDMETLHKNWTNM